MKLTHFGIYGLVFNVNKDSILLVKKSRGPYTDLYDLPGGTPENDESCDETLEREFVEEVGANIKRSSEWIDLCFNVERDSFNRPIQFEHSAKVSLVQLQSDIDSKIQSEDTCGVCWIKLSDIHLMSALAKNAIKNFGELEKAKNVFQRILIIGNSGSGKTYLAKSLSTNLNLNLIHFDEYFWEPGGFNKKRPIDVVLKEIEALSKNENWVMEGVFGNLAEIAIPNATTLIFLDKKWDECESALLERGPGAKNNDERIAEDNFKELVLWAKEYWKRENSCSHTKHLKLYSEFKGNKFCIYNRTETDKYLNDLKNRFKTNQIV